MGSNFKNCAKTAKAGRLARNHLLGSAVVL